MLQRQCVRIASLDYRNCQLLADNVFRILSCLCTQVLLTCKVNATLQIMFEFAVLNKTWTAAEQVDSARVRVNAALETDLNDDKADMKGKTKVPLGISVSSRCFGRGECLGIFLS